MLYHLRKKKKIVVIAISLILATSITVTAEYAYANPQESEQKCIDANGTWDPYHRGYPTVGSANLPKCKGKQIQALSPTQCDEAGGKWEASVRICRGPLSTESGGDGGGGNNNGNNGGSNNNGGSGSGEGDGEGATMACNVEGVGWIVCPVMLFLGKALDGAFNYISAAFLVVETGTITEIRPYWQAFLNIANALFVLAFLIVIFSQISGVGISNYGIKRIFPKLIITAVLMNLSFFICQLAIDLSNISGYAIKELFEVEIVEKTIAAGDNVTEVSTAQTIVVGVLGIGAGAVALWIALPFLWATLMAGLIAVISVVFLLIARKAIIVMLVVLSPLAFLALVLPNTEKLFDNWKKLMFSMLTLFPVIGLLYGGSKAAAAIITASEDPDWIDQIVALAIVTVPLFATYPLLKGALSATGKLGAAINNMSGKAIGAGRKRAEDSYVGRMSKHAQEKRADARERTLSGTYQNPHTGWRRAISPGAAMRHLASKGFKKANSFGEFGAQQRLIGQAQNREDEQKARAMMSDNYALASAVAQSGGDGSHIAVQGLSAANKEQFNRMKKAGHFNKASVFMAAARELSESGKGSSDDIIASLNNAKGRGADDVDIASSWESAMVAYRKSGRGDIAGEMQAHNALNTGKTNGVTNGSGLGVPIGDKRGNQARANSSQITSEQVAAWGDVAASSVSHTALKSDTGFNTYSASLRNSHRLTTDALNGYDSMDPRAKDKAAEAILAAAQHHVPNASIGDIEQAKAAMLAKFGGGSGAGAAGGGAPGGGGGPAPIPTPGPTPGGGGPRPGPSPSPLRLQPIPTIPPQPQAQPAPQPQQPAPSPQAAPQPQQPMTGRGGEQITEMPSWASGFAADPSSGLYVPHGNSGGSSNSNSNTPPASSSAGSSGTTPPPTPPPTPPSGG